uniref:Uncharacterized protein n=1 Tax=Oryza sativa subsp. japonica TaxID=39947 RepID=Q6ZCD4_ORYSJ|nr:hypothetical protein [Oryza sativa Japonica Group]
MAARAVRMEGRRQRPAPLAGAVAAAAPPSPSRCLRRPDLACPPSSLTCGIEREEIRERSEERDGERSGGDRERRD